MNEIFPVPANITAGKHYPLIKKLADQKLLQVVLFTGPPRCGTTATGKFGHKAVKSHLNVNQPGMFSRAGHMQYEANSLPKFVLSERDRNSEIWRRVYDQIYSYVQDLVAQGQQLSRSNPILLSAKETTHLTLFEKEVEQWRYLAQDRVVMSIRNPILQMRSALLMILDNIDTDIFSDHIDLGDQGSFTQDLVLSDQFSVSRNSDVREFKVHDRPLFDPIKIDLLLKRKKLSVDQEGKLGWPETYQYIKTNNDFTLLDDTALKRFSIYNPFMEEPEVQSEIWHAALSLEQYTDAMRIHCGTRMEEFNKLPDHLLDAMFRWRMGWMPTLMHLKKRSYPNLIVSEFTQMQINSEESWAEIYSELQLRGLLPENANKCLPYDICVDKQCELPWKAWFLDQDYKTVLGHNKITKPRNKIMIESQLPACLLELLPEAKEAYRVALSCDHVVGIKDDIELVSVDA